MFFSQDMRDLLALFERHQVDYVLVGGYAVNYYGYVRATQDIDLLIYPSRDNARKMMAVLVEFGFGGAGIPEEYFAKAGSAIHLGVEPNRIDLLTHLKGVENDEIFANRQRVDFKGISLNIIALRDLIAAKQRSERPRDRADADELMRTQNSES